MTASKSAAARLPHDHSTNTAHPFLFALLAVAFLGEGFDALLFELKVFSFAPSHAAHPGGDLPAFGFVV
jgi:hypothetical protein